MTLVFRLVDLATGKIIGYKYIKARLDSRAFDEAMRAIFLEYKTAVYGEVIAATVPA